MSIITYTNIQKHIMNYLNKELVRSFDWSDHNEPREFCTEEIINGRRWLKFGRHTSTSFVGDLYKLDVPSDEQFKYVLLIGMSRQHPNEYNATKAEGIEIASENAKLNPFSTIKLISPISYKDFSGICEAVLNTIPYQFLRTKNEREDLEIDSFDM